MQFKVGDVVQLNPAMRNRVASTTWRKLYNTPLLVKEISEEMMLKLSFIDDPNGGVVIGRNDAFILWDPEKSLLNIEEII